MIEIAMVWKRQCVSHSRRTGERCRKWAIRGATVCNTHGGAAAHIRRGAERRLADLVNPLIGRLQDIIADGTNAEVIGTAREVFRYTQPVPHEQPAAPPAAMPATPSEAAEGVQTILKMVRGAG